MESNQLKDLRACTTFLRNNDSYNAWLSFKSSGIRLKDLDFDKVMDCMRRKDYEGLIIALRVGIDNLFGKDSL